MFGVYDPWGREVCFDPPEPWYLRGDDSEEHDDEPFGPWWESWWEDGEPA
jgi:hypothetical protein